MSIILILAYILIGNIFLFISLHAGCEAEEAVFFGTAWIAIIPVISAIWLASRLKVLKHS